MESVSIVSNSAMKSTQSKDLTGVGNSFKFRAVIPAITSWEAHVKKPRATNLGVEQLVEHGAVQEAVCDGVYGRFFNARHGALEQVPLLDHARLLFADVLDEGLGRGRAVNVDGLATGVVPGHLFQQPRRHVDDVWHVEVVCDRRIRKGHGPCGSPYDAGQRAGIE